MCERGERGEPWEPACGPAGRPTPALPSTTAVGQHWLFLHIALHVQFPKRQGKRPLRATYLIRS